MRDSCGTIDLTIIVPTRNERGNIDELVRRLGLMVQHSPHLKPGNLEVLFVDDSTDGTPEAIAKAASRSTLNITCLHREHAAGGLGGAVALGMQTASNDVCLVLDGDLQHPPELIDEMLCAWERNDVDLVVASRYLGGGSAAGLANKLRGLVSKASTLLVKSMFPWRLRGTTDPMTGFFMVDRRQIQLDELRPQGFKILLEIMARQKLRFTEVPFEFGERHSGSSKASLRQGAHFLSQLLQLRFGRLSGFVLIGALGAVVNVALVWLLTGSGVGVFTATLFAAEVTIIGNFLLQDRLVFGDLRAHAHGFWRRFLRSFAFNNIESLIRIGLVVWIVDLGLMSATLATALLLLVAFVLRYVFHALVVYAPRQAPDPS